MTDYIAEAGIGRGSAPPPQRRVPPMITLPPRSSLDNLVSDLSPGPMTLVSNFFDLYPDTDLCSFSPLLPETLSSPATLNLPAPLFYHVTSSNCQKKSEEDKQYQEDLDSQSGNLKPEFVVSVPKPDSDGYKWRKYGQKQVKASELPRSYYKCTQINCQVTKKIGHFLNGDISEVIYKGEHNHEPPPFHKQAKDGAAVDQNMCSVEELVVTPQQVNQVVANEVTGDVAKSKKRKTELGFVDWTSSSRVMLTQPKIVVQTRSEVDVLDDGFKWRKYGQKVVKGNTYPRSYYRCAYKGCKVRKHVERAYLDPKSVVTTYEGKHKHDIPVLAKPSIHSETNFKTERSTYYI